MPDFNRACLSESEVNSTINTLIENAAALKIEPPRQYLGASIIGNDCLRKIQFGWMVDPKHPAQLRDIFERGHHAEIRMRNHLKAAGFTFRPGEEALEFKALGGLFRGHADGIIDSGPEVPGMGFPCLWECKCLGQKGWRDVERDGLEKAFPVYAAQVVVYQAYLGLTEHPALFSVQNANSCERLHLLVPFDAVRAQFWSDRAVAIIEATQRGQLLPRLTKDRSDWRCKMCDHRERCWSCQ